MTPPPAAAALAAHRHRWPISDVVVLGSGKVLQFDYPCRCGLTREDVEQARAALASGEERQ